MFLNEYENTVFDLPDADNNTLYVSKTEIAWVQGRDEGWTIFGICDLEGREDENLTPFLAISFIQLKQQNEGLVVAIPETGSKEENCWGSDDYDKN